MEPTQTTSLLSKVKLAAMIAVGMVLVFLGVSQVHENSALSQEYMRLDGVANADAPDPNCSCVADPTIAISGGDSGCGDGC